MIPASSHEEARVPRRASLGKFHASGQVRHKALPRTVPPATAAKRLHMQHSDARLLAGRRRRHRRKLICLLWSGRMPMSRPMACPHCRARYQRPWAMAWSLLSSVSVSINGRVLRGSAAWPGKRNECSLSDACSVDSMTSEGRLSTYGRYRSSEVRSRVSLRQRPAGQQCKSRAGRFQRAVWSQGLGIRGKQARMEEPRLGSFGRWLPLRNGTRRLPHDQRSDQISATTSARRLTLTLKLGNQ